MEDNTIKGLIRDYATLRDKIIFDAFAEYGFNREEVLSLIEEGRVFAREKKVRGKKKTAPIIIGIDGVEYLSLSESFDWDNGKVVFSYKFLAKETKR